MTHFLDPKNPWARGAIGERVYFLHPEDTPISLEAIARCLGFKARFNGATRRFYSVAEHSLHVSQLMGLEHGPRGAYAGLLHDAHEAYIGDVRSPLGILLGARWKKLEASWVERVRAHLGYPQEFESQVKKADLEALATEMRRLMVVDDSRDLPEDIEPDEYWDCQGGLDAGEVFYQRAVELAAQL